MKRTLDKGNYSSPETTVTSLMCEGPVCYSDFPDTVVNEEMDVIDYSIF